MINKYEERIRKIIKNEKRNLGISYETIGNLGGEFQMFGNIQIKNIDGLIGYAIALRNSGNNFFVNDILTIDEIKENDLEKIIKLNEKFANALNCSIISVEGGDDEIKNFYSKKGYNFEDESYIGVKELK